MKAMLVSSAIVLAAGGFAGEASAAGPCVHIFDPYSCNTYPSGECFWDNLDNRCEQGMSGGTSVCEQFVTPALCSSNPLCFWDTTDVRCEAR